MPGLNVAVIIQARMSSTRLPGKVLLEISGKPMLERVVERVTRTKTVNQIIIATTSNPADDPIEKFCQEQGYICYRGSSFDVLDRYYQAASINHADVIVRITADCPLIDAQVIDLTVREFFGYDPGAEGCFQIKPNWDFAANRFPPPWKRTYPIGLDTEVCTYNALESAWREATQPHQREHVMPFLYDPIRSIHFSTLDTINPPLDTPPGFFRVLQVDHQPDYGYYRWTVDTPDDLELIRQIFDHFNGMDHFSWREVLALFLEHPELELINAGVQHKSVHDVDPRMTSFGKQEK